MKLFHIIHGVVTLLTFLLVVAMSVLTLTGVVEVRVPRAREVGDPGAGPAREGIGGKARLLVLRGSRPDTEFPIYEGHNVIGRADEKPVDIDLELLESPDRIWSSRQHAVITCANGSLTIEDLGSANGTYVNRSRVPPGQGQPLNANDVIQIGEVQLKVLFERQ